MKESNPNGILGLLKTQDVSARMNKKNSRLLFAKLQSHIHLAMRRSFEKGTVALERKVSIIIKNEAKEEISLDSQNSLNNKLDSQNSMNNKLDRQVSYLAEAPLYPTVGRPAPFFKATAWWKNKFQDIDMSQFHGHYLILCFFSLETMD
jgi:hypothetical protein